ncbi:MAG TPA: Asp/Glu/hydantoin racemase [Candidatus Dorea intestinavium]|nr:Asp/Glu/hydantoin racemase [Candidatus Dorea intestinavium]
MKISLVYTSTTPELIAMVEKEIKVQIPEAKEIMSLEDPSILAEVRESGYVTTKPAARLIGMYAKSAEDGADAILNICSSVGEVADAAQDIARYIGIPIVRIDEEMCKEAVRNGKKIGVMATLETTLEPTKNTLKRVSRELNKHIELVDCLVEGAFGLDQEKFKELMLQYAVTIKDKVDLIVFAQGSMAYCEDTIANECKKKVLSSPYYGVKSLRKALEKKGLI